MGFNIGDTVVVNGADIGEIVDITQYNLGQGSSMFYVIEKNNRGATMMVPVNNNSKIRRLPTSDEVTQVFEILSNKYWPTDILVQRRKSFFAFLEKYRFKGPKELAGILRTLVLIKKKKGLSSAEKKLYNECRDQLIREMSLALHLEETDMTSRVENAINQMIEGTIPNLPLEMGLHFLEELMI